MAKLRPNEVRATVRRRGVPYGGLNIYFFDLSMTCKLGPWSHGSFETFLGPIQPLFEKLWPFLQGQSDNFVRIKSSKISEKSNFDSNFHSFPGKNCLQTYYTIRAMCMGLHIRY